MNMALGFIYDGTKSKEETSMAAPLKRSNDAFTALLVPVSDNIFRFINAMERDHEAAKDIMGDVLLMAYEKFETLEHEQAFLSWIMTIARRAVQRRRWRRRIFEWFDDEKYSEILPSDDMSPEEAADATLLYAAMAKLPEKQREAIALFDLAGLSLEEVRTVQGGSLSAVKMRLSRGREQLAKLLGCPP